MSSFSLRYEQTVEADHDACIEMPSLTLEESQRGTSSVPVPSSFLTLSNPLVQFLSPLQLQGYASRLIESCGVHHMDELAARVTSEDDVDRLLGSVASLQQRREFWKGLCKWKRALGKRGRERTTKSDKKTVTVCSNSLAAEVAPQEAQGVTTRGLGDLDSCTPSQFMRQLVFQGYKSGETAGLGRRKAGERGDGGVATVPEMGEDGEMEAAVQTPATPCRSTSWTSSLSPFSDSLFHSEKRLRREKMPLSALSMGPEMHVVGANEFLDEWGFCSEDATRPRNPVVSAVTPRSKTDALKREGIEQCRTEREALQEAVCAAVEKAIAAYNEGLKKIQERVCVMLAETKDSPCNGEEADIFEIATGLSCEFQLRAELHPAKLHEAGKVLLITQERVQGLDSTVCDADKTCDLRSGHDEALPCETLTDGRLNSDKMRVSSMASMTLVSPLSGSFGGDAIPTLSDITSPGRGSVCFAPEAALEGKIIRQNTTLQNHSGVISRLIQDENGSQTLPAAFFSQIPTTATLPTRQLSENIAQTSIAGEKRNVRVEDELLPCPGAATLASFPLDEECTDGACPVVSEPEGTLFLDHFGLNTLRDERSAASSSRPWHSAPDGYSMSQPNVKEKLVVESQVIDVDALSSSHSDISETHKDDRCIIPVENSSDHRTSCDSPVMLNEFSSQEDQDWICTQMSQPCEQELLRSSSVSPLQGLCETQGDAFSLRERIIALDWTTTSSMAADVQQLALKMQEGEDKPNGVDTAECSGIGHNITTASATATMSPGRSMTFQGLPPLPVRNLSNTRLEDLDSEMGTAIDQLTPERVIGMSYEELRKWCMQLGLRIAREEACANDSEDLEPFGSASMVTSGPGDSCGELTQMRGENSNGWWIHDGAGSGDISEDDMGNEENSTSLRSPHRHPASEEDSTTPPPSLSMMNNDESEWQTLQRAALTEQMRETLRLFIARRTFMQKIVPSFFCRLPRFSDGAPYKPLRAADLVKAHEALTRQDLEEKRCWAKMREAEDVVCCVITSLAGEAAECIEQRALSAMKSSAGASGDHCANSLSTSLRGVSPKAPHNAAYSELSLYEQMLLMEPADVQSVAAVVQADFPHVSRHRVETLLEESGVPLDVSRRVFSRQETSNGDLNGTQDSASSFSPPPSLLTCPVQTVGRNADVAQGKRHFFAQRHWMQRRKER